MKLFWELGLILVHGVHGKDSLHFPGFLRGEKCVREGQDLLEAVANTGAVPPCCDGLEKALVDGHYICKSSTPAAISPPVPHSPRPMTTTYVDAELSRQGISLQDDVLCDRNAEDFGDCLSGKAEDASTLISNVDGIITGEVNSVEGFVNIAEALISLAGITNPYIAVGFQLFHAFFDSDNEDHTEFNEIMRRFDEVDDKLTNIQERIDRIGDITGVQFCDQSISEIMININNAEEDYKAITTDADFSSLSEERSQQRVDDFYSTYCFAGDQTIWSNLKALHDYLMGIYLQDCGERYAKDSLGRSRYHTEKHAMPYFNYMAKAAKYLPACRDTEREHRAKEYLENVKSFFEGQLNEFETTWIGNVTHHFDTENENAESIKQRLVNEFAYDYHYSVVSLNAYERRDSAYSTLGGGGNDLNEGRIKVFGPGGSEDTGPAAYIFYRKKKITNFGVGINILPNPEYHCFCCQQGSCGDAWHVIRGMRDGGVPAVSSPPGAILLKLSHSEQYCAEYQTVYSGPNPYTYCSRYEYESPRFYDNRLQVADDSSYKIVRKYINNQGNSGTRYNYVLIYPKKDATCGTCGNGEKGNGVCSNYGCCSNYGWCGWSSAHCDNRAPVTDPDNCPIY